MSEKSPREPHLLTTYGRYLDDQDTVGFVQTISEHYTTGTLERLAMHPDPKMRCAALRALGYFGDFEVNQTTGRALTDDDELVRLMAALACRSVWNRVGGEDHRRQLADTIRLNVSKRYSEAIEMATTLLGDLPDFAEAWHQRGVARFQTEDYSHAILDFRQALAINPYHFTAAASMGDAYLQLGNPVSALDSYRRALGLNPDLEQVRNQVAELARQADDD